ncbi:MAG: hypothetical protein ACK5NC_01570 [Vibrio sp.]
MPLVQCPVCEKQISKRALACPGCGEPDPFHRTMIRNTIVNILTLAFWVAVIGGGAYAFWTYGLPLMIDFVKNK